jgi:NAD(P)-dependent dehydrogenase (short-subunit alcohol dehydrogenase family)
MGSDTVQNLFGLDDDVVLVTGGAGLLGEPVCRALAEHGATVVVTDVDTDTGLRIVDDLGSDAEFRKLDVTDPEAVEDTFEAVLESHGRLDALVNTAYPRTDDYGAQYEDVTLESWQANVSMNLDSCFMLSKCAAEIMREQPDGGSIVNFGSIYGVQAPDFTLYEGLDKTSPVEYAAIKSGVLNLTRYLASYLGPDGIRVNAVSPGGVYIGQDETFVDSYERRTPLGRMANAEDVCGAVVYLVSGAASYVTGHNLIVDGGWTIQ